MENSTIFDDVFRTMLEKMPKLVIPLINEVFGTAYPEDIEIIQKRNEHQTQNGRVIRMIEYDFAISLENVQKENGRYRIYFPQSCVLYLRGAKKQGCDIYGVCDAKWKYGRIYGSHRSGTEFYL